LLNKKQFIPKLDTASEKEDENLLFVDEEKINSTSYISNNKILNDKAQKLFHFILNNL